MERRKVCVDDVRDKLKPDMIALYDMAISSYKKKNTKPKFETTLVNGQITGINFTEIPVVVMSELFNGVMALKKDTRADFGLSYTLLKNSQDFILAFEIKSNDQA